MAVIFAEQELHNACQVLFGVELQISRGFLDYLQLSGIKSAYRKKAFETHPDKHSKGYPTNVVGGSDLFMAVQQAYESLVYFIDARKKGYILQTNSTRGPSPQPSPQHKASQAKTTPSRPPRASGKRNDTTQNKTATSHASRPQTLYPPATLYQGPIPTRTLLFGHYLYFSGLANWQTITKALVWQRTKRPRIGEIGCQYGWLSTKDILTILKSRPLSDSFGKSAVHQGFLTESQLQLLVFQQKRLQKKFGQYFVANKLLTETQVNRLVQQFRSHNMSVHSRSNSPHRDI